MKFFKSKMFFATLLCVFSLSLLFASSGDSSESESKFWGSECHTETTGGGGSCVVTSEVCSHYMLWIKVKETKTISDIQC